MKWTKHTHPAGPYLPAEPAYKTRNPFARLRECARIWLRNRWQRKRGSQFPPPPFRYYWLVLSGRIWIGS